MRPRHFGQPCEQRSARFAQISRDCRRALAEYSEIPKRGCIPEGILVARTAAGVGLEVELSPKSTLSYAAIRPVRTSRVTEDRSRLRRPRRRILRLRSSPFSRSHHPLNRADRLGSWGKRDPVRAPCR
jgi:hypothetical protein